MQQGGGRALDVAPVDVALKAQHERAELHVVADRAADQRTLDPKLPVETVRFVQFERPKP